ncbi:MAG: hypothetical protein ACYDAN_11375 [Candidatus Limnocylindrales bacterium]
MSKEIHMDTTNPTTASPVRGRRIPPMAFGLLIVAVFAGTIGLGMATGTFQTSGRTAAGGEPVTLEGETVTEIKGWMALGDVADAWKVPLPEVLAAFELPADTPPTTALKDLESDLFSVTALRDWLEAGRAATP